MQNERLQKRSETFLDDNGHKVEKRCFFLLAGPDDLPVSNGVVINIGFNVFAEPRDRKRADITITVHEL